VPTATTQWATTTSRCLKPPRGASLSATHQVRVCVWGGGLMRRRGEGGGGLGDGPRGRMDRAGRGRAVEGAERRGAGEEGGGGQEEGAERRPWSW